MTGATNIQRIKDGRAEHLIFTRCGAVVRASRYWVSNTKASPWLVVSGADKLPENRIHRGKILSALYNAA